MQAALDCHAFVAKAGDTSLFFQDKRQNENILSNRGLERCVILGGMFRMGDQTGHFSGLPANISLGEVPLPETVSSLSLSFIPPRGNAARGS